MSPDFASGPEPSSRSLVTSSFGGAPLGFSTFGFVFFFGASDSFELEVSSPEEEEVVESSLPQPATTSAKQAPMIKISFRIRGILGENDAEVHQRGFGSSAASAASIFRTTPR